MGPLKMFLRFLQTLLTGLNPNNKDNTSRTSCWPFKDKVWLLTCSSSNWSPPNAATQGLIPPVPRAMSIRPTMDRALKHTARNHQTLFKMSKSSNVLIINREVINNKKKQVSLCQSFSSRSLTCAYWCCPRWEWRRQT